MMTNVWNSPVTAVAVLLSIAGTVLVGVGVFGLLVSMLRSLDSSNCRAALRWFDFLVAGCVLLTPGGFVFSWNAPVGLVVGNGWVGVVGGLAGVLPCGVALVWLTWLRIRARRAGVPLKLPLLLMLLGGYGFGIFILYILLPGMSQAFFTVLHRG